jgi:NAD(P) transhydrogenase subunit alpha
VTPETVRKFKGLGAEVVVETGAGLASGISDADYEAAGASIAATAAAALAGAAIVLKVRRPAEREIKGLPAGALVVATMDPFADGIHAAHHARAGRWTSCPRRPTSPATRPSSTAPRNMVAPCR